MGTAERREREKAGLRQKILEAARDLFMDQGADSVTMRKIAERIEYSPTAIYAHFPDKEALLLALCEHDFAALFSEGAHVLGIKDPIERIVQSCLFYVEFALRHPHQYEFMFMTSGLELTQPSEAAFLVYETARTAVLDAMAEGRFRPGWTKPGVVMRAVWATVHGIAALQIAGRYELMQKHPRLHDPGEDLSPQHVARVALEALLHGFLNDTSDVARAPARTAKAAQLSRSRRAVKRRTAS